MILRHENNNLNIWEGDVQGNVAALRATAAAFGGSRLQQKAVL